MGKLEKNLELSNLFMSTIDDEVFLLWMKLFQTTGRKLTFNLPSNCRMSDDIGVLDLMPRSYNALKRIGVDSLERLIEVIPNINYVHHMGKKSAEDVQIKLFLYAYNEAKDKTKFLDSVMEKNPIPEDMQIV